MSRVAVYSGPYVRRLHGVLAGLGDAAICLDQNQNTIDCQSPDCTYGDCGAVSSSVPSGACLDQSQNQVLCTDPECTYGDCLPSTPVPAPKKPNSIVTQAVSSALQAATAPTTTPRPAPVVNVPLSTSSLGLWFSGSSFGIPNWSILMGIALLGAVALTAPVGRRR